MLHMLAPHQPQPTDVDEERKRLWMDIREAKARESVILSQIFILRRQHVPGTLSEEHLFIAERHIAWIKRKITALEQQLREQVGICLTQSDNDYARLVERKRINREAVQTARRAAKARAR